MQQLNRKTFSREIFVCYYCLIDKKGEINGMNNAVEILHNKWSGIFHFVWPSCLCKRLKHDSLVLCKARKFQEIIRSLRIRTLDMVFIFSFIEGITLNFEVKSLCRRVNSSKINYVQ